MSWLRAIPFLFTLLAFVLQPASASAFGPAHPEARVSAFELVALASVGASAETSPGLHEGIGRAYDENASGYRFAARGTGQAARALDPNKLHHIFGKAEHKLGPLLQRFGGSQEATFRAVESATQATVKSQGLSGVFTTTVEVAGQSVTVRGNVIEGAARIGSFWIP